MTPKLATRIMIGMVAAIIIFHLAILFKLIPYDITWGGRLENDEQMYQFETASILINLILILTLAIKGKLIKAILPNGLVKVILWIFFGLFALNTIGNVLAETMFEKSFALVTLLFTYFIWGIQLNKN